jgi:hypothetical protein
MMNKLERMALRGLADGDVAARRILGCLGNRDLGLVLEAGGVGLGEDRHRWTVGLDAFLFEIGSELLKRVGHGLEGVVPRPRALHTHHLLCGQRCVLAESIGRLGGPPAVPGFAPITPVGWQGR